MKHVWRVMLAVALLGFAGVLCAQGPAGTRNAGAARFVTCDVMIDSGTSALAAWQVDWKGTVAGGTVELVGVEGGDAGVYAAPAYYDPEALSHERVVLGAFSKEKTDVLPRGKTRVARLHLRVVGDAGKSVEMSVKMIAAADAGGKTIEPAVSAMLGDTP